MLVILSIYSAFNRYAGDLESLLINNMLVSWILILFVNNICWWSWIFIFLMSAICWRFGIFIFLKSTMLVIGHIYSAYKQRYAGDLEFLLINNMLVVLNLHFVYKEYVGDLESLFLVINNMLAILKLYFTLLTICWWPRIFTQLTSNMLVIVSSSCAASHSKRWSVLARCLGCAPPRGCPVRRHRSRRPPLRRRWWRSRSPGARARPAGFIRRPASTICCRASSPTYSRETPTGNAR